MAHGELSQRIRDRAIARYVRPAKVRKLPRFSVVIRDLMKELEAEGFPKNHPRQFCTAVQTKDFLEQNGLVIEKVDGPPKGNSTTVVIHYAMKGAGSSAVVAAASSVAETPGERAFRVTEKLAGRMKDVISSYGGTEGYIRWVRGYEDEE